MGGTPGWAPNDTTIGVAVQKADSAHKALQVYSGQVEDGDRSRENVTLAVLVAADAVCERLAALTMVIGRGLA